MEEAAQEELAALAIQAAWRGVRARRAVVAGPRAALEALVRLLDGPQARVAWPSGAMPCLPAVAPPPATAPSTPPGRATAASQPAPEAPDGRAKPPETQPPLPPRDVESELESLRRERLRLEGELGAAEEALQRRLIALSNRGNAGRLLGAPS